MAKVLILFYSMYGHIYKMVEAVAEGVKKVEGAEVVIRRVPELVPPEILEKSGAAQAQKQFEHIPIAKVEELLEADAIIFGTPTRFGNMAAQMRNFLDQTGPIWGKLVGKIGSVFTSSATQHGGQETTILSFHITLLHHGMIIVGIPPTFGGLGKLDEVTGGSYYGASTIAGAQGERWASENELEGARIQGERVASLAARLAS